jgi:hypothetical protein
VLPLLLSFQFFIGSLGCSSPGFEAILCIGRDRYSQLPLASAGHRAFSAYGPPITSKRAGSKAEMAAQVSLESLRSMIQHFSIGGDHLHIKHVRSLGSRPMPRRSPGSDASRRPGRRPRWSTISAARRALSRGLAPLAHPRWTLTWQPAGSLPVPPSDPGLGLPGDLAPGRSARRCGWPPVAAAPSRSPGLATSTQP